MINGSPTVLTNTQQQQQQHQRTDDCNIHDNGGNQQQQQAEYFDEGLIQAILAAKEPLEKQIVERDQRDILIIDHLCSLVRGFDVFPKTIRRALAAQAVLIVIDEKGKELIVHNEELDSFCVLIYGECVQLNPAKTLPVKNYQVGDSFGVCRPTTETIRFVGHLITKCENCAFLCVKRDDFYTILTDPANYPTRDLIKHKHNGSIICVSRLFDEKRTSGQLWTDQFILPDGHNIIKATEDCLLTLLVDGYDKVDPDYIDDFLLSFRVFMTHDQVEKERKLPPGMVKLCLALINWLDQSNYRDEVVKIVLNWLSSYYHDFELNSEFSYLFFKVLESRLLNLSMNNQLHLLHLTLSTKSKVRHVTISRSSREQPLSFTISGGYEKNCGIFITQVHNSNCDDCPFDGLMIYLKYPHWNLDRRPIIPPRRSTSSRTNNNNNHNMHNVYNNQDSRISVPLRPGDQILEVNGTNFAAIKLVEAQKKLEEPTHLSITVKYNPAAFHEMRALPEGKRKSSLSSSVSSSSVFTFPNLQQDQQLQSSKQIDNTTHQYPPPSPLFQTTSNSNFGFKSLSSLMIPKQFVKQVRESSNPASSSSIQNKPVNVLRVFNAANNDSKCLLIHEETTAREVVMVAVKEFNLTGGQASTPGSDKSVSSLNWRLYEVSVVPESKTIKQKCLSEQTNRLAERESLCSRFYIKNNLSGPTKLDMGDDTLANEILQESPANVNLIELNQTLLAVELTLTDFDKLRSVEPQQFIYDSFFDYSERTNVTDTTSLKSTSSDGQDHADYLHAINKSRIIPKNWMREYQEFADVSNKEMFWVICEILSEKDINKRVKIIKHFVKVADFCYQLRNYNSMFAIISGLGHSCVRRLKRTFEKLNSKYKTKLKELDEVFSPSGNMSNYRECTKQTQPPAIPLFPLIKKDLTFTKEGHPIFIRELDDEDKDDPTHYYHYTLDHYPTLNDNILVNFAEIRKFTKRVRDVIYFSSVPYSNDLLTYSKGNQAQIKKMHDEWQMRKRIRHYINNTLNNDSSSSGGDSAMDQVDFTTCASEKPKRNGCWQTAAAGKLNITYDEKTLYQRSLDVEPEPITSSSGASGSGSTRPPIVASQSTSTFEQQHQQPQQPRTASLSSTSSLTTFPLTHQAQLIPPAAMNIHPPSVASNSSPTLSKSSSLSSCSSFNNHQQHHHQHLPSLHAPSRLPCNNLTSSVGKFGTESTESLRKLQALRENDWGGQNSYNNNNNNNFTGGDRSAKNIVTSKIFHHKSNR